MWVCLHEIISLQFYCDLSEPHPISQFHIFFIHCEKRIVLGASFIKNLYRELTSVYLIDLLNESNTEVHALARHYIVERDVFAISAN